VHGNCYTSDFSIYFAKNQQISYVDIPYAHETDLLQFMFKRPSLSIRKCFSSSFFLVLHVKFIFIHYLNPVHERISEKICSFSYDTHHALHSAWIWILPTLVWPSLS